MTNIRIVTFLSNTCDEERQQKLHFIMLVKNTNMGEKFYKTLREMYFAEMEIPLYQTINNTSPEISLLSGVQCAVIIYFLSWASFILAAAKTSLMRIVSYNVNGIRSAINKGFTDWLQTDPADVICLQEIKAAKENVDVDKIESLGYETYWYPAQKKGYSGVAIFTKIKPDAIVYGSSIEQSDYEGRVIRADYGNLSVFSAYFPSGTSGDERQTYKYQWLTEFGEYLETLRTTKHQLVICGDYNIAHKEIDIHDPKGNKKSSGFLPEEREWLTQFLGNGYVDTFRHIHPEKAHHYSWWSQRFPTVRLQNKGWRIDYISVTDNLKDKIKDAQILPHIKHSDHCPVYVEIG